MGLDDEPSAIATTTTFQHVGIPTSKKYVKYQHVKFQHVKMSTCTISTCQTTTTPTTTTERARVKTTTTTTASNSDYNSLPAFGLRLTGLA
jgi:hypothetical protein